LRYFCSPQHTDSAFYPIIGQMERAAGLAHDDKPQAKLDKLDAVLRQTSTSTQDAALFAEMLSLPNDGRYPALELTPEHRRQRTLEALTAQLEELARRQPVLMIFEDAHWVDPTSLEVLGRTVDRIKTLPVLLIVTFRPEFTAPWVGQSHVTSLTLNRLGEREAAAIIARLAGNRLLPADVLAEIVERTDGIPLFVEEMTKAVLEAESEARRTVAAVPFPALAVPASLHASLMARLDRLGSAKEVAQIGAVIGREFSHLLLLAVYKDEAQLKSSLDRLIAAGLLFRRDLPPNASYLFKHALVLDAAYGTLLRKSRRDLHLRIAEALESKFPEIGESKPELLARHYSNAELIEKAAWFWGKAGERSLARSAVVEACEQLNRALDLLKTLPETSASRRQQLKLQIALANALMQVKGYAAPEPKAAFEQARLFMERAEALGEAPEDPLLLFSFLWGVWSANYVRFNGEAIKSLAAQFMELAERHGAQVPLMVGHRLIAMSAMHTGDLAVARSHFDRTIALYDPAEHRALAPRFGQDIRVAALSFRGQALWLLGYPELALADAERSITDGQEINHGPTLLYALVRTIINNQSGNYAAASRRADEIVDFATQKGIGFWKTYGMLQQGIGLALTGNAMGAVQKITSAINVYRSMGSTLHLSEYLWYLAKAHAHLGQPDDAWRCVDEAMATMRASGETWFEAELHRVSGEIALMLPQPDAPKAEAYFQRALEVARKQQAKSWELRAATSMARLWRDQGKQQARELLAPVYGWFTEGFDTRDLKEAKALLEELQA
jgi:predicted ATPase